MSNGYFPWSPGEAPECTEGFGPVNFFGIVKSHIQSRGGNDGRLAMQSCVCE